MMKPLVNGFLENSIHTNKLQDDVDKMEIRMKQLEVVFNGGQGQNFIYDACLNKFAEEVSSVAVSIFNNSDTFHIIESRQTSRGGPSPSIPGQE